MLTLLSEETLEENNSELETRGRAGLYVDVENLSQTDGRAAIQDLKDNWHLNAPPLTRLVLFVRADQVELWHLWAHSRFPELEVIVKGTQHFSMSTTKNSADIALATNAIADLLRGRVTHVVVLSDDSDFISLFVAIRDEIGILDSFEDIPFSWVVTDREGSVSATVSQFFPPNKLHTITVEAATSVKGSTTGSTEKTKKLKSGTAKSSESWNDMAKAVVEGIAVGQFKSTDCQEIIKERWPNHPLASAAGPAFGTGFKENIWPILQSMGAKISNPGKKPVRYEMTEKAKSRLG